MADNKDKIVAVAFILSLKKGFANVPIKEIQELSGLSTGSIYYHFKDKDEILEEIVKKYIIGNTNEFKNNVKNFSGSFIDRIGFIMNYIPNYFNQIKSESEYGKYLDSIDLKDYFELVTSIYHQHGEIKHLYHEMHDGLLDFYIELVEEAIEKDEIRNDIDVKTLAIFIHSVAKGYLDLWVFQPSLSHEEIADADLKMLQESIKK